MLSNTRNSLCDRAQLEITNQSRRTWLSFPILILPDAALLTDAGLKSYRRDQCVGSCRSEKLLPKVTGNAPAGGADMTTVAIQCRNCTRSAPDEVKPLSKSRSAATQGSSSAIQNPKVNTVKTRNCFPCFVLLCSSFAVSIQLCGERPVHSWM